MQNIKVRLHSSVWIALWISAVMFLFASPVFAITYEYDELNRLKKVDYENGASIIYEYDAAGNITAVQYLGIPPPTPDTTPPVITVPGDMVRGATGPSGAAVTYTASASDNVDGAITPVCTPASSSIFPIGMTTVTCTATDAAGNSASAAFQVTVWETIQNLTARAKPGKVDLVWTCKAESVSYNIYRSTTQGGPYSLIKSGHLTTYCMYADFGLTNGTTYYYRVRWVSSQGQESPDSNEASATPSTR